MTKTKIMYIVAEDKQYYPYISNPKNKEEAEKEYNELKHTSEDKIYLAKVIKKNEKNKTS